MSNQYKNSCLELKFISSVEEASQHHDLLNEGIR